MIVTSICGKLEETTGEEMSAEYLMKMEVLRRNREELTARRQDVERRIALREATAAEYSAIALQSAKQKWKSLRASAIAAKKRNDEFIREVHETQRKIDEVYVRTKQKLWPSDNQLELEKARYLRKVEELYPAWQEKMQAARTFETEQTLDDLIQQTSHEIGLAENLEKNEALEREVLRSQSAIQAVRLDETIREHAAGARMYMKQQAYEHLTSAQRVQTDVEEKIFETFSPRGAVKAMRDANASIALVKSPDNNAEDSDERPQRSMSIIVHPQQYRARTIGDPLPDPFINTKHSPNDSVTSARAWARSGLAARSERWMTEASTGDREPRNAPLTSADDQESKFPTNKSNPQTLSRASTNELAAHELVTSMRNHDSNSDASMTREHDPEMATAFQKLAANATVHTASQPSPEPTVVQVNSVETIAQPANRNDEWELPALNAGFMALAKGTPNPTVSAESEQEQALSANADNCTPPGRRQFEYEGSVGVNFVDDWHEPKPSAVRIVEEVQLPTQQERPDLPLPPSYQTYKFVEIKRESSLKTLGDNETKSFDDTKNEMHNVSQSVGEALSDDGTQPANLSLDLVNSFESNQSSVMDFSVGKLLQSPVRVPDEATKAYVQYRESSPPSMPEPVVEVAPAPVPVTVTPIDSSNTHSVRTSSFEKAVSISANASRDAPNDNTGSYGVRRDAIEVPTRNVKASFVFSSVDSASAVDSPTTNLADSTMIESVSDFGSPLSTKNPSTLQDTFVAKENSPLHSPVDSSTMPPSLFASMSLPEKLKALTALIARVEEGVNDGEQVGTAGDRESHYDTKRELLRMAASGRKAQINFFGSDVCFDLVVDLASDLGEVLFPAKAFEGILSDQKMKKVHQNGKEKESDMWKAFSMHIKQLHTAKAMPVSSLVDRFTTAFLSHDPTNQRSQRKLRELLFSVCGATETKSTKASTPTSPRQEALLQESPQARDSNPTDRETPTSPQIPTLLQTAFLQTTTSPKPKTYGIASSSFKKKSSTDDVLKSMTSSPTRLSQKLIRGGKMGDYSEFEEEDEVDLENLIGSKPSMTTSATIAKSGSSARSGGVSSKRLGGVQEDKDDFDVDF